MSIFNAILWLALIYVVVAAVLVTLARWVRRF